MCSDDYEMYDDADGYTDPYPMVRSVLAAEYSDLPVEEIEDLFDGMGLSAEDVEISLGDIGRFAGGAAKTVLPVAGTVVGTAFGGPVGGALGGALGGAAGNAIGAAVPSQQRPRPAAGARPVPGPAPAYATGPARGLRPASAGARSAGGSPAAAQLLQLLNRPELVQALLAMALGSAGQSQVAVGQTPVPAAAFGNLLGSLAGQAVAEHHAVVAGNDTGTPAYLLGADGELAVDTSNPDERAARLLEVLAEAEPSWPEDLDEDWDSDLDDLWDELDLLEAAEYGDD